MTGNNSVADMALKQSQNLLTHCNSCHKRFDREDHLPKFLPCHHSMWLKCILYQVYLFKNKFNLFFQSILLIMQNMFTLLIQETTDESIESASSSFSPLWLSLTCTECQGSSYQPNAETMPTNIHALEMIQLGLER